jgi:hypothetical protein
MISLSSRPTAEHLLATLCTIAASWPAQTKASLPSEIDTSSFNLTVNLPPAAARNMYGHFYKNNALLKQLFDYQSALIMQQAETTQPGLVLPQAAAAPASRNEAWGIDDAESPSQQPQPIDALIVDPNLAPASIGMPPATTEVVAEANAPKQKDNEAAWNILKAFETAGIEKNIPSVQKLIDATCPLLSRILGTQTQDTRHVGRNIMIYLLSLVLQVSKKFPLANSRNEIAQMLLNHAIKDAALCECAYDVWKNEQFRSAARLPIWTGLKKLIDEKEALHFGALNAVAKLAAAKANVAASST